MLVTPSGLQYVSGFSAVVASEAVAEALPVGNPHPQHPPLGLVHERVSGSPFFAPRASNWTTEVHRIRPTAANLRSPFIPDTSLPHFQTAPFIDGSTSLNPAFINPLGIPDPRSTFISGMRTMLGNGDAARLEGSAIHLYSFYLSMRGAQGNHEYFRNSDGHLMIIPVKGDLEVVTELGRMSLAPGEIGMIPRGIAFQVNRPDGTDAQEPASGYVWEVYGPYPSLPERGFMGTTGMSNDEDFLKTVAWFEDVEAAATELVLRQKLDGRIHESQLYRSPFDVVAFRGNYVPYKYDMRRFQDVNTVSWGHLDPSIKTALTSPWGDFVIFLGGLWLLAEDTFRPPWCHRNLYSEAMGQVDVYEAKQVPAGGLTVHNRMTGHGPDNATLERGRAADTTKPQRTDPSIAFMFESPWAWRSTELARQMEDPHYIVRSWGGFSETADREALRRGRRP